VTGVLLLVWRYMMTDKSKVILTDIDGVMLNWEEAFHVWMEHQGHVNDERYRFSYYVEDRFGITRDTGMEMVRRFNQSAAIGFLPPLRDAQYYVKQMVHQGYRFLAVTSLGTDPYAIQLRERNLKKLFGENAFLDIICLDTAAPKTAILRELSTQYPGNIWIEDKTENAQEGLELGFDSLIMEHAFNMDYQGDARIVKNWQEIAQYAQSRS